MVDLGKSLGSIKDYLSYDSVMQERGYKPIIRFITVHSYDNPWDRRTLVDTTPFDILVQEEARYRPRGKAIVSNLKERLADIGSDVVSSLTGVSGSITDKQRAFEGCMVDLTIAQRPSPQPYSWANIIFQNPLGVSPSGDQFFGTDFLKYCYPVWIQIGYVNNLGEIVGHPFDATKRNKLPVTFAGLIGSLDQEMTMQSSDRLLVQAADFRWYFENFVLGQGIIAGDVFVIKPDMKLQDAVDKLFGAFLDDGGYTAPKAILDAMGFQLEGRTYAINIPDVKFDRVSPDKTPRRPSTELDIGDAMGVTYLTMLQRLEEIYQVDINWIPVSIWETEIVVSPRLDPYSMLFDSSGKLDDKFDKRIHQAILGGNVRNWAFRIDAAGSVNRLLIKTVDPDSGELGDSFLLNKSTIDEILYRWKTESTIPEGLIKVEDEVFPAVPQRVYGAGKGEPLLGVFLPEMDDLDRVFGKQTKVVELTISHGDIGDTTTGIKLSTGKTLPYPEEAIHAILRRLHYWGAKGSVMLMGNADIREGDLIEVFDRRPKGTTILGFQRDVTKQTMVSFIDRYKKKIETLGTNPTEYTKNQYLGLGLFDNLFYIWKVMHYLGPQGFWTKVHFVKQRDSVGMRKSPIFKIMQERAKKRDEE